MLYVQCSMVWSLFEGFKKNDYRSHAITKETLLGCHQYRGKNAKKYLKNRNPPSTVKFN